MSEKLPNHSIIARLGKLALESRQTMQGNISGRHRSAHRGSSVEFAEYRKYTPGDDTRRLDWKAYARSDRYYIKEFEAETNLLAHIVLDASGSMNFAHEGALSKWEYAHKLSSILAYLAIRQGDAVGLAISQENSSIDIPCSRRPAHLQVLYDYMQKTTAQGKTNLVKTLHELAETAPRRGLVLIFSDLFTPLGDWEDALNHLRYRKHDVAIFHLMHPLELSFTFDRPMRFLDMEGGTSLITEPSIVKEQYLENIHSFLNAAQHVSQRAQADYHLIQTTEDAENILRNFLVQRLNKKGGRGA